MNIYWFSQLFIKELLHLSYLHYNKDTRTLSNFFIEKKKKKNFEKKNKKKNFGKKKKI